MVNKSHSDSFLDTDLTSQLEARGLTHLVMTGYMSQYCVDITARRAVALEYCVTSVGDGHGTTDDGALRHDQIVAHHNNLLCKTYHPDTELVIKGAKDISFS